LTLQPSQQQFASVAEGDWPAAQITARMLVLDDTDACIATMLLSDLPALQSPSFAAIDVLACSERVGSAGRNALARLIGRHNRLVIAATRMQSEQGASQTGALYDVPFGGSIAGSTSYEQQLQSHAEASVSVDPQAHSVAVRIVESADAQPLEPARARFAALYSGEWSTDSGFGLQVSGVAYVDAQCRSQAQLAVVADTHADLASISSRRRTTDHSRRTARAYTHSMPAPSHW